MAYYKVEEPGAYWMAPEVQEQRFWPHVENVRRRVALVAERVRRQWPSGMSRDGARIGTVSPNVHFNPATGEITEADVRVSVVESHVPNVNITSRNRWPYNAIPQTVDGVRVVVTPSARVC